MSRKIDDLDLIALRELGRSSHKVQDLIQEKNTTLIELEQKATVRFKKPDPAPSPSNDKRLLKNHSKQLFSRKSLLERQKKAEKEFNDQIKEAMIEKARETDQDYYISPLQEMSARDIAILNERGINAYKESQSQKEKEVEPEKGIAFDLDDESRFNIELQSFRFQDNAKDIDLDGNKTPDPADDFE